MVEEWSILTNGNRAGDEIKGAITPKITRTLSELPALAPPSDGKKEVLSQSRQFADKATISAGKKKFY